MPEEKTVPLSAFVDVVKNMYSHMLDLTVGVMVLRQALMQQTLLPVPAEEFQRLHNFFAKECEPLRRAREISLSFPFGIVSLLSWRNLMPLTSAGE